jgi:hypothetical protein
VSRVAAALAAVSPEAAELQEEAAAATWVPVWGLCEGKNTETGLAGVGAQLCTAAVALCASQPPSCGPNPGHRCVRRAALDRTFAGSIRRGRGDGTAAAALAGGAAPAGGAGGGAQKPGGGGGGGGLEGGLAALGAAVGFKPAVEGAEAADGGEPSCRDVRSALRAAAAVAARRGPLVGVPEWARMPSRYQRHWVKYTLMAGEVGGGGGRLGAADELPRGTGRGRARVMAQRAVVPHAPPPPPPPRPASRPAPAPQAPRRMRLCSFTATRPSPAATTCGAGRPTRPTRWPARGARTWWSRSWRCGTSCSRPSESGFEPAGGGGSSVLLQQRTACARRC